MIFLTQPSGLVPKLWRPLLLDFRVSKDVFNIWLGTLTIAFYPSNYHDGSNGTILTWNGNQIEDYKTHNCLECHQYADHAKIINRKRSVSGKGLSSKVDDIITLDQC